MDINSIKPNNDEYLKSKEEKTQIDPKPVIDEGAAHFAKKNMLVRILEFASGEDLGGLRKKLMYKVAIPLILGTFHSGIENLNDFIFGRYGGVRSKSSKGYSGEHKSYEDYWDKKRNRRRKVDTASYDSGEYNDLYFLNKWTAQEVYEEVRDYLNIYPAVTVAQLYRAANMKGGKNIRIDFTDESYGWFSLEEASIERRGDEYCLVMPPPVPINKKY